MADKKSYPLYMKIGPFVIAFMIVSGIVGMLTSGHVGFLIVLACGCISLLNYRHHYNLYYRNRR